MTSLDILFWLLIALLGGVAWAIEAGLTLRHRNVLFASTVSALASILTIMFWLPDDSVLELNRPTVIKGKKKSGERGFFQFEESDDEEGASGKNAAPAAEDTADADKKKADAEAEDLTPEHSRAPFRDCPMCPEIVIVTPKDGVGELAKPYAIGRLEVLRKEYAAFVQETKYSATENCDVGTVRKGKNSWRTPGFEQDSRHPVVCVTVEDAEAFARWVSKKAGRTYRLISEDRWDFAARAGSTTPYWQGETVNSSQANFGRYRDGTIPAGSLKANKFGLSDVNGNVWEILSTCRREAGGEDWPGRAQFASSCPARVLKGGAWNSTLEQLRFDAAMSIPMTTATNSIGFRVGREVDSRDDEKLMDKETKAALVADEKAADTINAKVRADSEKETLEKLEVEYKLEQAKIQAAAKAAEAKAAEAKAAEAKALKP